MSSIDLPLLLTGTPISRSYNMGQHLGRLVNPGYPGVPDFERQAWVHHKRHSRSHSGSSQSSSSTQGSQEGDVRTPMPPAPAGASYNHPTQEDDPMDQHNYQPAQ